VISVKSVETERSTVTSSQSSLTCQFPVLQIYPKPYDSISHRFQALVYELGVVQQ